MSTTMPTHDTTDPLEGACPGPCNRTVRHIARTDPDALADHTIVPGRPVWCDEDATNVRGALAALPDVARDLLALFHGRLAPSGDADGRHTTGFNPPSPSPAWDAEDDIVRTTCRIEATLRQHLQLEPAIRLHGVARTDQYLAALDAATAWLTDHATALLCSPRAASDGRTILALHRRGERGAGTDALTHRLPGACPRCDARGMLVRPDGEEVVSCRMCGSHWSWDHWQWMVRVAVDHQRQKAGAR